MKWNITKKDLEDEWNDEHPVHVTWVDYLLNSLIIVGVIFLLWLACSMASKGAAKTEATIPVAGVTKHLMVVHKVGEVRGEKLYKEYLAKKEKKKEEKAKQKAYEEALIAVFGYLPSGDEIVLFKRVAMHESGNTEPHEGIVALMSCFANRVARDERFPGTIIGVGYQSGQMTCVTDGSIWRGEYTPNAKVEAAWEDLISGGYLRHRRIVFWTAGHYNPYCVPAYSIGGHCFGY